MNRVLQGLLTKFVLNNGRKPNAIELLQLRFKAAQTGVDERKIISMFDRQPVDANQPIIGGQNLKKEFISETDAQILARLKKGNNESLSNMKYEKAVKAEEAKAAADEDYIMKIFDPEDFASGGRAGFGGGGPAGAVTKGIIKVVNKFIQMSGRKPTRVELRKIQNETIQKYIDFEQSTNRAQGMSRFNTNESLDNTIQGVSDFKFPVKEIDQEKILKFINKAPEDMAKGGRAGLYQGGQAEIEPSLSDIGHGSDALMARNALLTPGSQATTSTGLNYLLGEDNDTTRVPYKHGDMVLPKEKPMDEYILKKLMSQAGAETLDARTRDMFIQMYKKKIKEKNSKADGGRIGYNIGLSVSNLDAIKASASVPYNFVKGVVGNFKDPEALTQVSLTDAMKDYLDNVVQSKGTSTGNIDYSDYNSPTTTFSGLNKFMDPVQASLATTIGGTNYTTNSDGSINYTGGKYDFNKGSNPVYNFIDKGGIAGAANKFGESIYDKFNPTLEDEEDEINIKMRHIDKKKQEKIKQETATFKQIRDTEAAEAAAAAAEASQRQQTTQMAAQNKAAGIGGYQSSFGQDKGFMEGSGTAADMGSFAHGGPARQNFKMGKRAFLKFLASGVAGIAGLKSGLLGFGKKSAVKSVIAPATQAANEAAVPPYFLNLVKKIKNLGDDVTETGALAERQTVKRYKDFELTEDKVTGRQEITRMKVDGSTDDKLTYDASEYYGKPLTEETYMSYTPGENIIGKGGKPVKTQPEYEEGRALLRNDRGNKGEIVEEIEGVSDDVIKEGTVFEDTLSEFGKADGGRIGYKLGKKVV